MVVMKLKIRSSQKAFRFRGGILHHTHKHNFLGLSLKNYFTTTPTC